MIYNSTKGSLFLVMVGHAAHNVTVDLMPMVGGSAVKGRIDYVGLHGRCTDDGPANADHSTAENVPTKQFQAGEKMSR